LKIVFLDLDGVLNSHLFLLARAKQSADGTYDQGPARRNMAHMLDRTAVLRLNRLLAVTGAQVVISSSWRIPWSCQQITRWLVRRGFKGDVIGRTPTYGKGRGNEIQQWLVANGPVASFVILDDDSDMEPLQHRHVKTTWGEGLLDEHVDRAILMLG
jgi:hypothetical protein